MSLILNIDTAMETAQVSLARDAIVLGSLHNDQLKDHAAFLQPAIQRLLQETGVELHAIDAVAVISGPGSYTGLRVGMASAKGLCYALKKPLITVGTLEVLAAGAIGRIQPGESTELYCPMIDARRMEVFTALYDRQLRAILAPVALILDQHAFEEQLAVHRITFFGNGTGKWKAICKHPNAVFISTGSMPEAMAILAEKNFLQQHFAPLALSEPFYLKEFYSTAKK